MAWLFTACSPVGGSLTPAPYRPDRVVLITIDTLRADHLHSYGYIRNVSPTIDEMARRGVQFMNTIAHMPTTAPSHASIFTSLYPSQHGVITNYSALDGTPVTMAEAFRNNGYITAGFSSITFLKSLSRGFAFFEFKKPGEKKPGSDKKKPNRKADETVGLAIDWLRHRQPADHFFLWVHIFDVHQWLFARDSEPAYLERVRFASSDQALGWKQFLVREHGTPKVLRGPARAEGINRYDSQLLFADHEIKRLFDAMQSMGLNRNSLWVITADHGEGLWNHGIAYHTPHLYDEQLRVPLVLFSPEDRLPAKKVSALASLVDLFPTLVSLAGLQLPQDRPEFEGKALTPLILGAQQTSRRYIFSQRHPKDELNANLSDEAVYSLRDLNFKYIRHSKQPDEFYDLRADRLELSNLIDLASPDKERLAEILRVRFRPLMDDDSFPAADQLQEQTLNELRTLGYAQ